jgi:2,3-bisphosphoglycerate-dependent phosphoglycerate mutase
MAVFLQVDDFIWAIGEFQLARSFFDTVHCLLEKEEWGGIYPHLMKELYAGRIAWQQIPRLKEEIDDVRLKLSAFPPSAVVWNKEDPDEKPPWEDNISEEITDMSKYYITARGHDLFDDLYKAMDLSMKMQIDLQIVSSLNGFQ